MHKELQATNKIDCTNFLAEVAVSQ